MIRSMEYSCNNCYFKDKRGIDVTAPCYRCHSSVKVSEAGVKFSKPSQWLPMPDKEGLGLLHKEEISRAYILDEAKKCVCGQREEDYGSPEDNFKTIASLWTSYKGAEFTPVDVSMMMALLKIARISTGTATKDSFVDLAGYAACGGEIKFKEENK